VAFAVRRGGGYTGAEAREKALEQARADGTARRLRCLVLADPRTVALGGEPVRADPDGVLGFVTSGGYRHTVKRSIAYALLPLAYRPGAAVEVEVDGQWVGAEVAREPLYDPEGKRIRG
jgi:4-methylaminobutanoate oxidase (formaldehyde-forming)